MIRWWAVGVGGRGGLGEHLGALAGGVVLSTFGGDQNGGGSSL
ncbi:hypothetical protein [Mycobacterium tuberculosis]|nr:hypothetical protein [Mycobacterium tuberculosis]